MLEFEVLAKGSYSSNSLLTRYDPQSGRMPLSDEVKASLSKAWQQHIRWSNSHHQKLVNEQLLRLVDFETETYSNKLTLRLSLTDYREYVGTRSSEFFRTSDRTQLSNPLGTQAVVISADNKILCGKRPAKSNIYPGRYYLVGGYQTHKDLQAGSDLFQGICREIHEETGISYSSHQNMICTGLIYDVMMPHPELCFSTHVTEYFETIRSFRHQDQEVQTLEFIDNLPESISAWILHLHPTQVVGLTEGCLLLHGLQAFGESWYNSTFSQLAEKP